MKTYTITEKQVADLIEAMLFYAYGHHEKFLSNRNGEIEDWDKARTELREKGYQPTHEGYDGSEWFVENGRVAENAVLILYDVINPE